MNNQTIFLWNDSGAAFRPYFTAYLIDDCLSREAPRKRGAVLICPGGGYGGCSTREGEPVALRFMSAGYHAFVLEYTTAGSDPNMRHPQPLLDVARAMTLIRQHAEEWDVDADKIAVCGFSAGGHLAASLATLGDRDYVAHHDGIANHLPNALILAYPVISSGDISHRGSFNNLLGADASQDKLDQVSLEKHVSGITPPAFLWHTADDTVVPVENSIAFAQSLRKHGIPLELHIYPNGNHGLSLANEETASGSGWIMTHVQSWMELCIQWLRETL